jgi:hypothetical protein
MCKSDFGEEFPIIYDVESLFRTAVRSKAASNAKILTANLKGRRLQGCSESKSPHSRSTVKIASEKIRRQRDFVPAERKTSEPA